MKLAYNGSQPVVDVPDLGLHGVKRGEHIDIEDRKAYRQLRRQGWSRVREDDNTHDNGKGDGN